MTAWYKESFGEDYLLVYKHRSQEEADQQIASILPLLDLRAEDHILDLCCGTGRHSVALAKAGYRVTGLDLSETLLTYARQQGEGLPVTYMQGDMRELPFKDGTFNVVLNLFTSFGYFIDDSENEKVLQEISRVLERGGRYLIDFLNRDYVQKNIHPLTERQDSGLTIREERTIDGEYVKKKIIITEGADKRTYRERVKMYTREEMQQMIEGSGLTVDRILGGYDGANYSADTPRMMFFGHKRVK